ncbi:major facilitator superfamily domain-containing protein [Plectosphaerella cucumerina]|uniref:Major facilitator superfamily domain-containing protein n=1 Tax=Plectosphaerella cucumerina TaxID=40658 RepID=A0A8K0X3P2_9PEZI|nr:major facilitator superfamily domain-containing protein [Plectosphaerella cucumerina]
MSTKEMPTHMEDAIAGDEKLRVDKDTVGVTGTVQLTAGKIVYIPAPTADPRDPLNMSTWQKVLVMICLSLFSTIGLGMISGFGGLLSFYIPNYASIGKGYNEIGYMLSLPNLTMGIGNLLGMPLAIAVGRRSILLIAVALMCASIGACAGAGTAAENYDWHLWARMLLGVAAGQSEALVPMVTQEIFFLHERARFLMIQQTIQTIAVAIFVLFASPIAYAIGTSWWYGIGCGMCGVCFVISFFFVPETKYYRPQSAYQEAVASKKDDGSSQDEAYQIHTERPPLDFENFKPRTWRSNLRFFAEGKPEWHKAWIVFRDAWTMLLFPNVFWGMLVNGVTLGANIALSMTYGRIVEGPPYNWPHSSTSYSNAGQIVTSLVALPVYGYGSDWIIKYFARRRGGIHEPETRLIPLFIPICIGVITIVLYGQGATHPENYHWFLYVWSLAAYFFTFIGANIVAITYLLDSYPQRASSVLILLCSHRGFLSFGVVYRVWDMVDSMGYDKAFGMFGGLTGLMGVLGVVLFFTGKSIRRWTSRWVSVDDRRE